MPDYRCYLMNLGRIRAVELLVAATDDEAIKKAETVFSDRAREYTGFEVWQLERFIHRFPNE